MKLILKKITSLTLLADAVLIIATSLVLFVVPHGRVAYWSNWKFLGMTKAEWTNLHINLGFLFLLFSLLHLYFNWHPILSYLNNRTRNFRLFTREFNIALSVVGITILGTIFMIPPFSSILNWSESIKDSASVKYGEPPYGHAELSSFAAFCEKTGLDSQEARHNLEAKGIRISDPNQKIEDIARAHNLTPQALYVMMQGNETTSAEKTMPADPPPGTGMLTLVDICTRYGGNMDIILRELKNQSIHAIPQSTIKQIATDSGKSPRDIYSIIFGIQTAGK